MKALTNLVFIFFHLSFSFKSFVAKLDKTSKADAVDNVGNVDILSTVRDSFSIGCNDNRDFQDSAIAKFYLQESLLAAQVAENPMGIYQC